MTRVPQKTIYIRQGDEDLWEWARRYAEVHRTTISGLLMNALERYKAELEGERDDDR